MVAAVHLLAGAAIVSNIHLLPLAFILALLSHFFFDTLPHREYPIKCIKEKTWRYALFDFSKVALDIICGALFIFLLSDNLSLALAGGLVAFSPDGLTALYFIFPRNKSLKRFFDFHCKTIHYPKEDKKIPFFWGILSQVVIAIIAVLALSF